MTQDNGVGKRSIFANGVLQSLAFAHGDVGFVRNSNPTTAGTDYGRLKHGHSSSRRLEEQSSHDFSRGQVIRNTFADKLGGASIDFVVTSSINILGTNYVLHCLIFLTQP